jgi:tRNA(Met) cytidine acetyltransferase
MPGGFLFIICPKLESWPCNRDEFAKKRTSHGQPDLPNSPNTIQRFIEHCQQNDALFIQQPEPTSNKRTNFKTPAEQLISFQHAKTENTDTAHRQPWSLPNKTNPEQTAILNTIKHNILATTDTQNTFNQTSNNHKQFHIIQADRGRGKSHLLGLIANTILEPNIDNGIKYYVTAPNKAAIQSIFSAQKTAINVHSLEFIAPERILETVNKHDILLVDEAASLPVPLLMSWSVAIDTIIFATTSHGYEGTGKGFQIRFLNHLKQLTSNIHQHHLNQPIRYASSDPLERIMFSSFCLNAEPKGLELSGIPKGCRTVTCKEITKNELTDTPYLLENLFALLVQAHYQTRPSDLRDILDSSSIRIFSLFVTVDNIEYLASACLVSTEGNFTTKDDTLITNIINGTRRPKGHLIPQVLTLHMGQAEALKLNGGRVIRIATLPNLQNQNHGSKLLTHTTNALIKDGYDYIGSSYADTPDVNKFWEKNGFSVVRTGNKLDKSSGTKSKLVLKSLSNQGHKLIQSCIAFYDNQSAEFQAYNDLNGTNKLLINRFINETGSYEAVKDILQRCKTWEGFYNKQLPKKASKEFRQLVLGWTKL